MQSGPSSRCGETHSWLGIMLDSPRTTGTPSSASTKSSAQHITNALDKRARALPHFFVDSSVSLEPAGQRTSTPRQLYVHIFISPSSTFLTSAPSSLHLRPRRRHRVTTHIRNTHVHIQCTGRASEGPPKRTLPARNTCNMLIPGVDCRHVSAPPLLCLSAAASRALPARRSILRPRPWLTHRCSAAAGRNAGHGRTDQ